jgi:hypothetical protein
VPSPCYLYHRLSQSGHSKPTPGIVCGMLNASASSSPGPHDAPLIASGDQVHSSTALVRLAWLVLGMQRGNRRESLMKPHLAHVDLHPFCPRWFCRVEQHRLQVEPPPAVRPSAPPKPILPEVIALYINEVKARPKLLWVIVGVELIKGLEAVEEYRPAKVPRGRRARRGHMLVHDWWGTKRIVNMKGP